MGLLKYALLVIGDGREAVHERSWASASEHLPIDKHWTKLVVDDTDHELGFAGAIAEGWRQVVDHPTVFDYVFHLEADFTFREPVPVDRMAHVLAEHPYLAQMALLRQPVNDAELAAGGIIQTDPESFTQRVVAGDIWTEHRRCFTTNPCLYPAALAAQGWPQVSESEGKFTHRLLGDESVRFAFWGAKTDPPLVDHIGTVRAGHGY